MDADVAATMTQEERLRRLLDVGRSLVSELDLDEVLERVMAAGRELTGARYAAIGVLDERREQLQRFLTSGLDAETIRAIGHLPRGRGVLGVLTSDPQPLRLREVGSHARSYGFPPGHPPMRTFLGVPIRVRDEVYGNLYLTEKAAGEFDEADEDVLVVLAEWAAIAIENARAYSFLRERRDELERTVASLEATGEIADALAGDTDLDHVLELIVKRARALTEARAMVVLLHDGDDLVVAALAGELDGSLIGARIPIAGSVSGHVLRSGRAERLDDAPSRLRFALAEQTQAKAGLFVPLRLRGTVLGVLSGFDRLRDGPEFSDRDEHLLTAFATSAAAAVATAQDVRAQTLQRSIVAAETERKRWARELHDDTLQELAALKLMLSTALIAPDDLERDALLNQSQERIMIAMRGLRDLITDLRPATLDELGLEAALEALTGRVSRSSELRIELNVDLAYEAGREPTRLVPQIEETLYRVVQESLTNVIKHSSATKVEVAVREEGGEVEAMVADNGHGFDAAADHAGFGLLGMRERVALVGGRLSVDSASGLGTIVRIGLPVHRTHSSDAEAVLGA
ncbi:MAG: GAF domain-containing protein [Actinomycetota bacterium]